MLTARKEYVKMEDSRKCCEYVYKENQTIRERTKTLEHSNGIGKVQVCDN